jgi:hypothetical protein
MAVETNKKRMGMKIMKISKENKKKIKNNGSRRINFYHSVYYNKQIIIFNIYIIKTIFINQIS